MKSISAPRKGLLRQEQLDIIIGYACNANCPHCIQDIRYQSDVAGDQHFFTQLRRVFDYYFHEIGGRRVIITGGEPSIFPHKLLGILRMLQDYPVPEFIATYTNGSGLLKQVPGEGASLLEKAAEEGLTDLNLSVHDYESARNRAFMRLQQLPDAELIANESKKLGIRLRLNCNLIAEHIGDFDGVVKYLEWGRRLQPKDIYLRDLHRIQDQAAATQFAKKAEKILYVDRQRVDFDGLVQKMLASPLFTLTGKWGYKHAGQGEQYNFIYQDLPVRIGYIDIGNEDNDQATYFVFAPDGKLYADWNGPGSLHNHPVNLDLSNEERYHEKSSDYSRNSVSRVA